MMKPMTMLAMACLLMMAPEGTVAQQGTTRFASTAPGERIHNLNDEIQRLTALKAKLRAYHDCTCPCGCYEADMDTQAEKAIAFLRERVAKKRPNEHLAIVLDIDETTLSNYEEMDDEDFGYNATRFDAWIKEEKAPAIPATLRLYKVAESLHVAVFFLTGRDKGELKATVNNLEGQGFGKWDGLILRSPEEKDWSAEKYKSYERQQQIFGKGYTLVLNVGDQWSDLRGAPEAEYSVKYPDPFYFIQ
jgi:acid phosphatase